MFCGPPADHHHPTEAEAEACALGKSNPAEWRTRPVWPTPRPPLRPEWEGRGWPPALPERPTHRDCGGRIRPAAYGLPATCDACAADRVAAADIIPPTRKDESL